MIENLLNDMGEKEWGHGLIRKNYWLSSSEALSIPKGRGKYPEWYWWRVNERTGKKDRHLFYEISLFGPNLLPEGLDLIDPAQLYNLYKKLGKENFYFASHLCSIKENSNDIVVAPISENGLKEVLGKIYELGPNGVSIISSDSRFNTFGERIYRNWTKSGYGNIQDREFHIIATDGRVIASAREWLDIDVNGISF